MRESLVRYVCFYRRRTLLSLRPAATYLHAYGFGRGPMDRSQPFDNPRRRAKILRRHNEYQVVDPPDALKRRA